MDWDEDGRKDLILGENNGNVRIYLNTNTDADPQFSGYTLVLLNGATYDVGSYSAPFIDDWNEDGRKDLLVGNSLGTVMLLLNSGTNAAPVFTSAVALQDGSGNLDPGSTVCPVVYDWNADNTKDLLLGDSSGFIHFYPNIGTNAAPVFNGHEKLKAGPGQTQDLDVGSYARPYACDWDEDGLSDIITGYYSGGSPNAGALYYHGTNYLYPDLEIRGFTTPPQADPGENVSTQIKLSVRNAGGDPAGSFYVSLYVSEDNLITMGDHQLVDGRVLVPSLLPGDSYTVPWPTTLAIPTGLPLGNQYLGVLVDDDDSIFELNENNNSEAHLFTYGAPPLPDIKIDGDDGPITIPSTQSINMTISLDPGSMNGVTQDIWILAYKSGGGVFAWVYNLPYHWTNLYQKAYRGPLFPITSYTIRNGTIPAGTWTIEFSIDDPNIFHEKTYWDEIEVISY